MKLICLLLVTIILYSCCFDFTEPSDNPDLEAPQIAVTSPNNNSEFILGERIEVIADASDNIEIDRIEFYIDGEIVLQDSIEPYMLVWDTYNSTLGNHLIYSMAYDSSENNSISNTVIITLSPTEPVTDVDGNVYQTKLIGDQIWMTENLRVTHYRNGNEIQHVTSNSEWNSINSGAYCFYNNDSTNVDLYGIIYNWRVICMNVAPTGWHIPTEQEIMELEMYLGMDEDLVHNLGFRGTNEGSKLCGEADLWNDGELENDFDFNSSGFKLLPGGYRGFIGEFSDLGICGYFWTSTESSYDTKFFRKFNYNETDIYKNTTYMRMGYSIRCVKD